MKNSTKLIAIALVAVAAIFGAVQPAAAQVTGSTNVAITLNPLVILYYYSDVNVNLDSTNLAALLAGTSNPVVTSSTQNVTPVVSGADLSGTLTAIAPTAASLATVQLTLANAWTVRSFGSSGGQTTVSIAAGNTSLTGTGGTITLSAFNVLTSGVSAGNSISFGNTGLSTSKPGDVRFSMNLTGVTTSGLFSGTGTEYTITVSAT